VIVICDGVGENRSDWSLRISGQLGCPSAGYD
jgi:hypothetical protein